MFENDLILREIQYLTRMLGKVFFQKDVPMLEVFDEEGNLSESGFLLYRLKALIYEKRINEAENLLFEALEQSPNEDNLKTSLLFYSDLQELSDEALTASDFSKEEIVDGLAAVRRLYEPLAEQ